MIFLLFSLILTEMGLITMFVFKTPLRKLVIMGLDRVKMGQGPIVVKTVGATVSVVMLSSVYNVVSIQKSRIQDGDYVNPTDQVLSARSLLEASLMGFSLFLALMIDRLHYYIRELRIRRKGMEAIKKQNRPVEDVKAGGSEERKALEDEAVMLREKFKKLQSELEAKTKEAKNAESNAIAMRKQSEGFLLEYDRLLEDNQNLRNQLQAADRGLPQSGNMKVM
ncbi:uncharacterized protein LOC141671992 [Apium graveolens]|uniref:uncharacterized protein LOC141671992 n=1 Tax=Apium graveolens TaxID=4045 RepID=UPI003D79E6E7